MWNCKKCKYKGTHVSFCNAGKGSNKACEYFEHRIKINNVMNNE